MRCQKTLLVAALTPAIWAQQCPKLEIAYARATTEPPTGITAESTEQQFTAAANRGWSKGYGAAGASLVANVTAMIPGSVGYPVPYPANFNLQTSGPAGSKNMLKHLSERSQKCPQTKFVLGGHSQGGGVTVGVIPKIPKDIISKVIAVTMFGSPPCPAIVQDRCKSYCNSGDNICEGGGKGGKGGAPKSKGPPRGKGAKGGQGMGEAERILYDMMQPAAGPDCAGVHSPATVQERGHNAPGREGAHLMYNKDGYYVKAAACYILQQWKRVEA